MGNCDCKDSTVDDNKNIDMRNDPKESSKNNGDNLKKNSYLLENVSKNSKILLILKMATRVTHPNFLTMPILTRNKT